MNQIERLALILIIPALITAFTIAPLYEWGEQIAARNDCKSVKCLIDKFHLFEVMAKSTTRYELDILLSQKKFDEYKRLTIKP